MTTRSPESDNRNLHQQMLDLVDDRLMAFYHFIGLLEAEADVTYTRKQAANLVRLAYLEGIDQKTRDPHELSRFTDEWNSLLAADREASKPH